MSLSYCKCRSKSEFCVLSWMLGKMDIMLIVFCVLGKSHKFYTSFYQLLKIKEIFLLNLCKATKNYHSNTKAEQYSKDLKFPHEKVNRFCIFLVLSKNCFKKMILFSILKAFALAERRKHKIVPKWKIFQALVKKTFWFSYEHYGEVLFPHFFPFSI